MKLEERLRETENAIKQHIDSRASLQRDDEPRSPPSSPDDKRKTRKNRGGAEIPKFKNHFKPTPKPATAKSRLRWDDGIDNRDTGYGSYEDRLNDLTFDGVSDDGDADTHSRRSSHYSTARSQSSGKAMRYQGSSSYPSKTPPSSDDSKHQSSDSNFSSSHRVVSILKDVLADLISRETRKGKKVKRGPIVFVDQFDTALLYISPPHLIAIEVQAK
jgi:hypothetical protein